MSHPGCAYLWQRGKTYDRDRAPGAHPGYCPGCAGLGGSREAEGMNIQAASDLLVGLLDFIAGIPPAGSRRNLILAEESGIFEDEILDEQAINREAQVPHALRVARECRSVRTFSRRNEK